MSLPRAPRLLVATALMSFVAWKSSPAAILRGSAAVSISFLASVTVVR